MHSAAEPRPNGTPERDISAVHTRDEERCNAQGHQPSTWRDPPSNEDFFSKPSVTFRALQIDS